MKIQIIHRACGGTEFLPQPSRLHLGAQNAEGVDRLVENITFLTFMYSTF
mgnify:CR=1 FL=1